MSYKIVDVASLSPTAQLAFSAALGVFEGAQEITLNRAEGSALIRFESHEPKAFQKGVLKQHTVSHRKLRRKLRPRGYYASQAWAEAVAGAESRAGEKMIMARELAKMAECDRSQVRVAAKRGELKNWANGMHVAGRQCFLFSITEATKWASAYRQRYDQYN